MQIVPVDPNNLNHCILNPCTTEYSRRVNELLNLLNLEPVNTLEAMNVLDRVLEGI